MESDLLAGIEEISVRVSPHSYFAVLLLGTFASAFLFYLELDASAIVTFLLAWVAVPFLAMYDRVEFDGTRLARNGIIPKLWAWLNTSRRKLKISDIEQVETQAVRAIKRGGNVHYRYRTLIRGKGVSLTIASGGESFRHLMRVILSRLPANVLDTRSMELRDHLADPKETLTRAEFARIPSAEVLEGSVPGEHDPPINPSGTESDEQHAEELRDIANKLRISGYFPQALEAFRRALRLRPRDGRLLFEFARCLYSFAGSERDRQLQRRALAAFRLSERRAEDDADLLVRLGEAYLQIGDLRRAGRAFRTAIEKLGENFRAARGLAELALQEGKIAHVIHHFSTANRVADTPSLRRWSRGEADYFSNLNSDEEYMDLEIGRVNMLESVERGKKTVLRIALLVLPAVLVGILVEDFLIANIGWGVSGVALLIWIGLTLTARTLSHRIPYDLVGSDD